LLKTLSFITHHPLTRDRPLAALGRFARWQVESRIKRDVQFDWIEGSKLVVRNGMTGATGNIYCGLHEFADMAFVLHLLRPGDLFVDVGANIGSYTVLASAVAGADTISVEPDPGTMASLKRNIEANAIGERVSTVEAAVGANAGTARFTVGRDTVNRIASEADAGTRAVRVMRLDDLLAGRAPILIKLDVEGFEAEVLAGGRETLGKRSLIAIETESRDPAVVDQLTGAGFHEVFYDPMSRTLSETVVWAQNNALFVRDRDRCLERLAQARRVRVLTCAL